MCRKSCSNRSNERLCPDCEAEYLEYATEENRFSELVASDPCRDPSCKPASDREWRDYWHSVTTPAVAETATN